MPQPDLGRLVGDMYARHSLPPFMSIGLFQEKSKQRGGGGGLIMIHIYISEKTLGIYIFVTLPL